MTHFRGGDGERYVYHAGRPVLLDRPWPSAAPPHFLRPTQTTSRRAIPSSTVLGETSATAKRRAAREACEKETQTPATTSTAVSEQDEEDESEKPRGDVDHDNGSWVTREPLLANCFQDHVRELDLATTAFILCKEAFWH